MLFAETRLKGAYLIDVERRQDERGFFGRSWCKEEFEAHGLDSRLVQCNISFNSKQGTVRGMHYQTDPYQEPKLVRCTMGTLYDVIIDLRPDSASFTHWLAVELTSENRRALYIPKGFAHDFKLCQIIRKSFTKCRSSTILKLRVDYDGMTRHLVLNGLSRHSSSLKETDSILIGKAYEGTRDRCFWLYRLPRGKSFGRCWS
jgi:dTDP-4-dehydrorhamnose 3,5-epimerase